MTNEETRERALDRRVQARLATDRAYLYAENAEEQAERERQIEEEEERELEAIAMTRPMDGRLSTRVLVGDAADVMRNGPRSRIFALRDELGKRYLEQSDELAGDAWNIIAGALEVDREARRAEHYGNRGEEDAALAVFTSYTEALADLLEDVR